MALVTKPLFQQDVADTFEEKLRDVFKILDPDEEDAEINKVMDAQKDYEAYLKRMAPDFTDGDHLRELRHALKRITDGDLKRLIVTMPPRHSKTWNLSERYPAFRLGKDPDMRVMAISHTQQLANKNSGIVRAQFNDPLWPFPEVKVSHARGGIQQWDIAGSLTGGYIPMGVSGSPTGLGFDLLVIDDPIRSQKDAMSETIRDNLWDWYNGTIYTRRMPGAAIIVTSTRWHEDDLTGRLLQRMEEGGEQWEHLYFPAMKDDGTYLWPEFWSDEEYEKAQMQSDRVWTTQYMGRPSAEEGEMFREEWFPDVEPGTRYEEIVTGWDCAAETGDNNDYSVGVTIGISQNSFDVLHISRDKVDMKDLVDLIKRDASWVQAMYRGVPYTIAIENKYPGKSAIQLLERNTRLPVQRYDAESGEDKITRVIDQTPVMKSRRLRIPVGSEWRRELMAELKGFPFGKHDDQVDALMIAMMVATGVNAGASHMKKKSYISGNEEGVDREDSGYYRKPRGPRPGRKRK